MGVIGLAISGQNNVREVAQKLGIEFKGDAPTMVRFGIHPNEANHFLYEGQPSIVQDTADNGIEISLANTPENLSIVGSVAYYRPGEFLHIEIYPIVKYETEHGTDIGLLHDGLFVALWDSRSGVFRVVNTPVGEKIELSKGVVAYDSNYSSLQDNQIAEEIKEVLKVFDASGKDYNVLNSSWLGFSDRVVDSLHAYRSEVLSGVLEVARDKNADVLLFQDPELYSEAMGKVREIARQRVDILPIRELEEMAGELPAPEQFWNDLRELLEREKKNMEEHVAPMWLRLILKNNSIPSFLNNESLFTDILMSRFLNRARYTLTLNGNNMVDEFMDRYVEFYTGKPLEPMSDKLVMDFLNEFLSSHGEITNSIGLDEDVVRTYLTAPKMFDVVPADALDDGNVLCSPLLTGFEDFVRDRLRQWMTAEAFGRCAKRMVERGHPLSDIQLGETDVSELRLYEGGENPDLEILKSLVKQEISKVKYGTVIEAPTEERMKERMKEILMRKNEEFPYTGALLLQFQYPPYRYEWDYLHIPHEISESARIWGRELEIKLREKGVTVEKAISEAIDESMEELRKLREFVLSGERKKEEKENNNRNRRVSP